jgi:hypothetical protein
MLLFRLLLRLIFGDPDSVQRDETQWPTWVVVLIVLVIGAALLGGYFWLAYTKTH